MTNSHLKQLNDAKEIIRNVYWDLVDNKEFRAAKRLDTIVGKIESVEKLIAEGRAKTP